MRILLLHPEDSPLRGPWAQARWDQIVDLGKSSASAAAYWEQTMGCPVLRLQSFRRDLDDPRAAGEILRAGFGQLLDDDGLDWWELTSIAIHSELETVIALQRLATQAEGKGELHATRADWPVSGFSALLGKRVHAFANQSAVHSRVGRLMQNARRLSLAQMNEIFWDKYDAGYRWRSRWNSPPDPCSDPVVLLPSAYTNVSRMAADYAQVLPEQKFLLVATRDSGLRFHPPSNVNVARLASYACHRASNAAGVLERWHTLRNSFEDIPEMALLARAGVLARFPKLIVNGIATRDAWKNVFHREPVACVMCGDDTNWNTRIPVLLAKKRNLPTLDFHHGAFDGRFLLKTLPSDFYLAKNEMERDYLTQVCALPANRIVVGAPKRTLMPATQVSEQDRPNIVFFSEPYESTGSRPEEIYRELLPALDKLARECRRRLVVKLHPFESPADRWRLVRAALGEETARIQVIAGPLSKELMASTWCGITVESSTVLDCAHNDVICFQCEWLVTSPWRYVQQFARYRVGQLLHAVDDIAAIPRMLAAKRDHAMIKDALDVPITAEGLRRLLAGLPTPIANSLPRIS